MQNKMMKKYFPVFVLPTLLAFTIGFIVPFIMGVYLSFCKFTTVTDAKFVGLQNYVKIFTEDGTFGHALWYTTAFTVVSVVLINVIGFAVALLLTKKIKGTNIFRTVFFMPNLIGGIILGYVWQLLLNGLLLQINKTLTYSSVYGFWGLVILMCWQQIGYMMIIYIAGLQNVPDDLIEAAEIDGAGPFKTFLQVIIPVSKPVFATVFILDYVAYWSDFMWPLLVITDAGKRTVQLGIQTFFTEPPVYYGPIMAALTIASVPMIIMFLFLQKYYVQGISTSGIKG